MLSDNVATAIMTASITGAGLVIAFYALLARMSDKMFAIRFEQLDERRREIKQISSNPDSFNEKNLKKTTSRLDDLEKEVHSMKSFPKYLGLGVILSFMLFLFTSIISFIYVTGNHFAGNDSPVMALFIVSIILFFGVGFYSIFDVNAAISGNFQKLKKQKEEIKQEITNAPEEVGIASKIESLLRDMKVQFDRAVTVKAQGVILMPDFVIPSAICPKYMIDVLIKPTHGLIDNFAREYRRLGETNIKTILVGEFNDEKVRILAEAHWDYVISPESIEKLRTLLISNHGKL
jgi:flagellar biosynthesis protein FlhB